MCIYIYTYIYIHIYILFIYSKKQLSRLGVISPTPSPCLLLWQSIGCECPESFLWPRPTMRKKDIMLMVPSESWKHNKHVRWYHGIWLKRHGIVMNNWNFVSMTIIYHEKTTGSPWWILICPLLDLETRSWFYKSLQHGLGVPAARKK